ncbi:hypothetical protein J53TS2_18810 [Paenibacillus sp. J53TS2]|nr:hypothetical protein J53TS2_18810 [Paenibacillus sp. J53TS2]
MPPRNRTFKASLPSALISITGVAPDSSGTALYSRWLSIRDKHSLDDRDKYFTFSAKLNSSGTDSLNIDP